MKKVRLKIFFSVSAVITLILGSCSAIRTAPFDQYSYQKAVEIKVDASQLMDKATTPYQNHTKEIMELLVDVEKIVVYEENKPNNEITYEMWKLLSDKDKNLLAGFFKKWEEKGQFSQVFLRETKTQVIEAMDLLIQYEGKKDTEAEKGLLQMIFSNQ